ncbi:MAG TPA: glycosyltransferase [Tepidisphaeraceae bacterium]|jgi:glycosyltransferase involved in cell wall biosynthesis|nr:glycosyltransferase [Tepidisphaeraceae bacterium]
MPVQNKNILFYCGGFQPVGGVESFTIDLINSLPREMASVSVAWWGKPLAEIPDLAPIKARAAEFHRSFFRWGCRWALPDRLLLPAGSAMARRANLLVFAKVMPATVHLKLREVLGADGRPIPSVLVSPYRPSEMWPDGPEKGLLDCFDAVVVATPSFAEDLKSMDYHGRAVVLGLIPPPASPIAARAPAVNGVLRLGYLGRFEHQKNLDYLLDIFRELPASDGDQFEMHFFGDGSLRGELERKAAAIPAAGRIIFHGIVSGKAKWDAIDSCDLFVNTSISEGQCLVALEVLSRGRPLLATPVGALPDIIDSSDMGALIPLRDAPAAAKIVCSAASRWKSGEINPAMIRARFDRRFGRDAIVSQYVRLFKELMNLGA